MDWREHKDGDIHTGEEIGQRLRNELPHWYIKNGWIQRKYNTTGWNGTLLVINTVARLAEAAVHDPDLTASCSLVIVKLRTHSVKGLTNKDFELAQKIEEAMTWHTHKQRSVLEGAQGDPDFDASTTPISLFFATKSG